MATRTRNRVVLLLNYIVLVLLTLEPATSFRSLATSHQHSLPLAHFFTRATTRTFMQNQQRVPFASASTRSSTGNPSSIASSNNKNPTLSLPLQSLLTDITHWPRLVVLDLDNTIWTPELYQIRQQTCPRAGTDIHLFDEARQVLEFVQSNNLPCIFAVASRTSKRDWADQLLGAFSINKQSLRSLFDHVVIKTGSKKQHFADLRDITGIAYSDMVFIDDDERLNLREISQLGVLCAHTPHGMTIQDFVGAIKEYNRLVQANEWRGVIVKTGASSQSTTEQRQGQVKFYNTAKKFGFVTDLTNRQDVFFHESKVPAGMLLQAGDKVVFEMLNGGGKPAAVIVSKANEGTSTAFSTKRVPVATTSAQPAATSTATESPTIASNAQSTQDTTTLPCISMSQPFASLLINKVKTVESRKNDMLSQIPPGTRVLLHVGRKDWPDLESYRLILAEAGMAQADIDKVSDLPTGFKRGSVVGVWTAGETRKVSAREKETKDLQRRVVAPAAGIGTYCTEVIDAKWLKKPLAIRGQPGVFEVTISKSILQNKP
jgi:magnesium-dependent phosphatase 1